MSAAIFLPPPPRATALADAVAAFEAASREELERASLQCRFDRKFLLRADRAADVVRAVTADYRVVLARGRRLALYDTTYFDTPSLRCYHDRRRRRLARFKVRIRNYLDRELSMLEFKEKTPRGETRKARWKRPDLTSELTAADEALLAGARADMFDEGPLVPQARTVFHRLMLLNAGTVERATLDFGLALERGPERRLIEPVVVVEVKDGGRGAVSPLVAALRRHGARPTPFSKYCVAVALLAGERANAFRPTLRALEGEP